MPDEKISLLKSHKEKGLEAPAGGTTKPEEDGTSLNKGNELEHACWKNGVVTLYSCSSVGVVAVFFLVQSQEATFLMCM